MEKKELNLLIWILAVAGFILALLYSPLGNPDAYNEKHYFEAKQEVNFFGKITNAPKSIMNYQNSINEISTLTKNVEQVSFQSSTGLSNNIDFKMAEPTLSTAMPTYNNNTKKRTYSVSTPSNSNSYSTIANYAINQSNSNYTARSNFYRPSSTAISSTNGGSAGGRIGTLPTYNTYRNTNNNPTQPTGFTAISVDLSLLTDSVYNRQDEDTAPQKGNADPGDGPSEEPIPVGDGGWLLVFMAAIYAAYTRFKK